MLFAATIGSNLSASWEVRAGERCKGIFGGLCKAGRSEYPEVIIRRDELSHDGSEVLQENQWQVVRAVLLGPVAHGAFPLSHSQNCICYKQAQETVLFFFF